MCAPHPLEFGCLNPPIIAVDQHMIGTEKPAIELRRCSKIWRPKAKKPWAVSKGSGRRSREGSFSLCTCQLHVGGWPFNRRDMKTSFYLFYFIFTILTNILIEELEHKLLRNAMTPTLIVNVSEEHKLLGYATKPTLIVNVSEEHKLLGHARKPTLINCQCFWRAQIVG